MTLTGLVSAGLLVAAAAAPALAADGPAPSGTSTPGAQDAALPVSAVPDDLPSGVPAAALAVPATLPTAAGWTLPEPFPRTSGTGRHSGGVFAWSDFLFDDHGAGGPVPVPGTTPTMLAPAFGTATYPDGPAAANGADVFRTALGVTPDATSFRVDWTTLADPDVPVAVLGLGAADGPARAFPGGAGVSAAGLERAVVLSSRGAWLHDLAAGTVTDLVAAGAVVTVDEELGAFVLTAPRSALDLPDGVRLWLVAGLADASGEGLAPAEGVLPGASRVYNAAFRDYADEDVVGVDAGGAEYQNFWFERAQALALTAGDVTAFSVDVDVAGLRAGRSDPEPQPTGYSNRWYVSSLDPPGDGVDSDAEDLEPAYLGRVQPYAVDVPSGYDPATPASLTWMLHSLGVQHNQYGALDPQQRADTCEARGSICATTLGFGPAGWYFDEAELDFWEVWRDLADTYSLDPERTVLTGYSMGGYGTYSLGAAYPDLFAQAQMLAAPPLCGIRTSEDTVVSPAGPGPCTTAGSTTPLLPALRHVPFVVGHGAVDELVPVTSVLEHVAAADAAGLRYDFHLYPAAGHLAWAVSDGFTNESAALRLDERTVDPGTVDYPFYPQRVREDLGFGAGRRLLALRGRRARRGGRAAVPGHGGVRGAAGPGGHARGHRGGPAADRALPRPRHLPAPAVADDARPGSSRTAGRPHAGAGRDGDGRRRPRRSRARRRGLGAGGHRRAGARHRRGPRARHGAAARRAGRGHGGSGRPGCRGTCPATPSSPGPWSSRSRWCRRRRGRCCSRCSPSRPAVPC